MTGILRSEKTADKQAEKPREAQPETAGERDGYERRLVSLEEGVKTILDALTPQTPNGGTTPPQTQQAPIPAVIPNGIPNGQPGQNPAGALGALGPLMQLLSPQGQAGEGGLAEQMLLMSFKDQMDTNAILRRVALDKLTGTVPHA